MTANISCLVFTKTSEMQCFPKCSVHANHSNVHHALPKCPNSPTYTMHSKVCTWLHKCMRADHAMICTAFKNAFLGMTMPFAKKSSQKLHSYHLALVVCASFKGDAHCGKPCAHTHTSQRYAFVVQNRPFSYRPLTIDCMQKAVLSNALKCSSLLSSIDDIQCTKKIALGVHACKMLTPMGCSPSIQVFTPPFEPFAPFHNPT